MKNRNTNPTTGFHATSADQFAAAFASALSLPAEETLAMRQRARDSAKRFTEEAFANRWVGEMQKLIELQRTRNKK